MKYFTPDLLVRGQSEDSQIVDQVEQIWDESIHKYQTRLDQLRPGFGVGLRQLDERNLHDALVRIVSKRDHELSVVLQMETPEREMLHLRFALAGAAVIDQEALPEGLRSEDGTALWLYEEVERADDAWRLNVLLSNGWELDIPFHELIVESSQALWPTSNIAATHRV